MNAIAELNEQTDRSLLIVEDDKPFLERLSRAMETRGFAVTSCDTVSDGLAQIGKAAPAFAVVDLRLGDAQELELADQSFDTVVCTLALCTIPNPASAVAEAYRVLRPGGRYVAFEHVRSPALAVRAVQRALDPVSVRFAGDHLVREPLDYLRQAGFETEQPERSKWGIVERVIARKPESR